MKSWQTGAMAVVCVLLAVAPAAAQSGKSLAKCDKALAKETTKLAGGIQKAVSKCLDKIQGEVLAKGDPVADAAKACASSLRKLENSEAPEKTLAAKFAVKAATACDPTAPDTKADHTAAEALDPNDAAGLQAGVLGTFCGEFGGDGGLDTVGEWIDCAAQAAACSALQQVAVEYPRAPEWLGQVAIDITALGAEAKYTDAAATASALLAQIDGDANGVADIACGPAVATCGNGTIDGGEECDQSELNGSTCVDEGFAGGVLRCGAGCVYDTSECYAARFVDNGDGTITDNETGLMWEKKVKLDSATDLANRQDADNVYRWSGTCSVTTSKRCQPDAASEAACLGGVDGSPDGCSQCTGGEGTCTVGSPGVTVWQWLAALNTANFATHNDWRLAKIEELKSIESYAGSVPPAVDVAFHGASCGGACTNVNDPACSCTRSDYYWSAATYPPSPEFAWCASFSDGRVLPIIKPFISYSVRAVRGGS